MGMEQGAYIDGERGADFNYGYGAGESSPGTISAGGEAIAWVPIDFAPYEPQWGLEPPNLEPIPVSPLPDLPFFPGLSQEDLAFAWEERFAEAGGFETFNKDYFGQYEVVPDPLPFAPYEQSWPIEEPRYFELPFVPYEQSWPIEEPRYFELPPPPPPPTTTPKLPPACAGGTYHPYPIGHSQQDICVPFPPAQKTSSQQQSKPPAQSQSPATKPPTQQQSKPPAQQTGCPQGYCKHPQTGQWIPTPQGYYCHPQTQICSPRCTTPGAVFDQSVGRCVPVAQAVNPLPGSQAPGTELPEGLEDFFADLKKLPWWLWAAAAGLLLLGSRDEDGKKTTSTYRRR